MPSSQYELCQEVLRRLRDEGALERLVLVGSWCLLLYRDYFKGVGPVHAVKTRDMDFLILPPASKRPSINIPLVLDDLGFISSFRGSEGYLMLQHPELMIEFLVPERGRGERGARDIPELGVNAQPLRFMDIPLMMLAEFMFGDIRIKAPHPVAFCLHKLLICGRRSNEEKRLKDLRDSLNVLDLIAKKGDSDLVYDLFKKFPLPWQKTIAALLRNHGRAEVLSPGLGYHND